MLRKERNIVRIKTGFEKGWQVKVHRRGVRHEPFFGDTKHGGATKALEAAIRVRDDLEKKFPRYSRRELVQLITKRTPNGVRGVRWRTSVQLVGGKKRKYVFAEAMWCPEPGKVKHKSFSVDKYGKKQAWIRAMKARRAGLREMTD